MTSTPIRPSPPHLKAIRKLTTGIEQFKHTPYAQYARDVHALLDYTEALIAALRELLSHVEDTGPPDYARLVEIRSLLSCDPGSPQK